MKERRYDRSADQTEFLETVLSTSAGKEQNLSAGFNHWSIPKVLAATGVYRPVVGVDARPDRLARFQVAAGHLRADLGSRRAGKGGISKRGLLVAGTKAIR